MADTVKKSRIVSDTDDNLEESLMEEFNLRLKNCMSQDNLTTQEPEQTTNLYENVEAIKQTNGKSIDTENTENASPSHMFLIAERENHYDVPRSLLLGNTGEDNGADIKTNGLASTATKAEDVSVEQTENIYETLPNDKTEVVSPNKAISPLFIKEDHYEDIPDIASPDKDYVIVDSGDVVEDKPVIQKPTLNLPTTCLTDFSNTEPTQQEIKSVKDRMFLSSDDTSCLLFTQTVTSPMLTPSEENIDFLKGFNENLTQTDNTSPKSETEDKLTDNIEEPSLLEDDTENIYENADVSDRIYENISMSNNAVDDCLMTQNLENNFFYDNGEHIYANVQKIEEITFDGIKDRNTPEVEIEDIAKENGDRGKDEIDRSGSEIFKNLTSQYLKSTREEEEKVIKWEQRDLEELKTLNIMKQINKFENKEQIGVTNMIASTQTFQTSSYVETTMMETNASDQDKGSGSLKKKKSKKSRKEEKENISVSETNSGSEESFYNVNVKSLCRSFGDLTKMEDDRYCNGDNRFQKARTRSMNDVYSMVKSRTIENVFDGVNVKALKSSFNKFDALQKKNLLHVRSSDSSKAQEKFSSGAQIEDASCKSCSKPVFQMEQIKAEKAIWHKNCFRCCECNKQLTVDTYESHEGTLYCKPHFKALFAPKVVEDEVPPRSNRYKLIICENQPMELPPDVVRASDKPDLGLEELQSLNVKERFQVFEHYESEDNQLERNPAVNVKRSPSILSKLARFQAKGMDVGVADESLNGIPIEESSSEEEEVDDGINGDDADLIRAKRVQKEKPFHFTGMSDVKSKWEQGEQNGREERREERKQEIQTIRNRLFMGKQGKMKEMYQQAVLESEQSGNVKKAVEVENCDTRSIKERFEKGELVLDEHKEKDQEDLSVIESGISKKSRSIFLELDANAAKSPPVSMISPSKSTSTHDIKKTREMFLARQQSEDVVKSSEQVDDVTIQTADIQQRFKFFETYKEPEKTRRQFRITPPREGQVKAPTPEKEVYHDPDVVRAEEYIEDSVVAKQSHTATKMLNKFRQMEENLQKETVPAGPKPLKRFTPPPEPARTESSSGEEESGSEEESEENEEVNHKVHDGDLLEAQKAARAKALRAKFEKWEASEIKRDQNNSSVNIAEEIGEEQSQIESTRSLRARFESMREISSEQVRAPRVKVNRFVEITNKGETCQGCRTRVYPLEKVSLHGHIYHRSCFKCMECGAVLRMDSYSYNQGLLYCLPHFKRLFISKGNYDTGFGFGQHKEKWNTTVA